MTSKFKSISPLIIFVSVILLTFGFWLWFEKTAYYQGVIRWSEGNLYLIIATVIFIKIIGIVWPPLPGGIFSFAAIPLIGWFGAFTADFIGNLIGNSLAYFIGKKYGYKLLNILLGKVITDKIRSIKVKKGKELETVMVYRFLMSPIMLEGVSYGSGLLNIPFLTMTVGMVIPHIILGVPTFYLLQFAFGQDNYLVRGIIIGVALVLIVRFKDKYFE